MITLKELTIDLIIENVNNRSCIVLDPTQFIDEDFFAEDFPPQEELDKLPLKEKNKKIKSIEKKKSEGITLDLQTINVILKSPYRLLKFIDVCWNSVK